MNIHLFSFTNTASKLALTLSDVYTAQGFHCTCYTMKSFATMPHLTAFSSTPKEQVKKSFASQDALVFIGACGIAVRMIAPFIQSKTTDPCVLCIDERGQFVISLLSGHLGGGNDFALETSKYIAATPIISTATDLNHKFAVDNFAKKNQLTIDSMPLAKSISAQLLQDNLVGITSSLPLPLELPEGLIPYEDCDDSISLGICISPITKVPSPFEKTLFLYPKQVVLGIGCKKDIPLENIESLILDTLNNHQIKLSALHSVASIDLKKDETGLIAFCEKYGLPFVTYSAEDLLAVEGSVSSSSFVKSITGVDSVCERAALKGAHSNQLLISKTASNGVTVAASLCPLTLTF